MSEVSIVSMVPNAEDLLSLEPEELAGVLLEHLCSLPENSDRLHRYNFLVPGQSPSLGYPEGYRREIDKALTEAWGWLEREVLIAVLPGARSDFVFVTRRGRRLANRQGFESYRHAALLPKNLLHPVIALKVYPAFLRGEYDTAIFQAFREVEVAVRAAGGYDASKLGVELMRLAFDAQRGPLADKAAVVPEREAMAHLFAAAIGLFKNPASHRLQADIRPVDAVERIMLASHLLHIVDERTAAASGNSPAP
jgi:uncharacterized protein (TIGR02391 family)